MPTTPPSLTLPSAAPDPNDRSTYNTRAYPWSVSLGPYSTSLSALAANVYENSLEAEGAAGSALTYRDQAAGYASSAGDSATAAQAAQAAAEAVVATIPDGTINDATTTPTSIWSSSKVSTELSDKASTSSVAAKQDTLVSGTNIKTVNGSSLLGSGNLLLSVPGYVSSNQTITAGGALTIAHGLGATPRSVTAFLVCHTATSGYGVGDVVAITPSVGSSTTLFQSIVVDATNIYVRFNSGGNCVLIDKTTGNSTGIFTVASFFNFRVGVIA